LIIDRLESDGLTLQAVREVEELVLPSEAAVVLDRPFFEVARVVRLRNALRVGSRRRTMKVRRPLLVNRLMRPFHVVEVAEAIAAELLSAKVSLGRPRGSGLQIPMHPFVAAVVLRLPRAAEHRLNAELHQSNAHGRYSTLWGAEWRAVVGVDRLRKSMLPKDFLDDRPGFLERSGSQCFARQQKAAEGIHHRQRVATLTVPEQEVALVVDRVHIAGSLGWERTRERRAGCTPLLLRLDQAIPVQDLVDRASSRPVHIRMIIRQAAVDLLGPNLPGPGQPHDEALHLGRDSVRASLRRMGTVDQTRSPLRQIPISP